MAPVLKTGKGKLFVGSNPTPSARPARTNRPLAAPSSVGPAVAGELGPHPWPLIPRALALRPPAPHRPRVLGGGIRRGQRPGGQQSHAEGAQMHLHVKISP